MCPHDACEYNVNNTHCTRANCLPLATWIVSVSAFEKRREFNDFQMENEINYRLRKMLFLRYQGQICCIHTRARARVYTYVYLVTQE